MKKKKKVGRPPKKKSEKKDERFSGRMNKATKRLIEKRYGSVQSWIDDCATREIDDGR